MDLGLSDKVAIVTGGSRGIGRGIVLALAREGVRVVATYAGNRSAADETTQIAAGYPGTVTFIQSDVKDPDAAKSLVDEVVKMQGELHILVNNAGVALDGLILRYKDEDLDTIYRTNVFGAFYLCRAAARPMMKAKFGRFIMMGSVVGSMGNVGQAAYAGTKAALDGMAKSLAKELATRNITANVIAPGFIQTDMTDAMNEEAKATLLEWVPTKSLGTVDDVADATVFLASERARYITGHVLHVNGGLYMG
ncbi:MAG: 3-oxoacyl-ACP reductase FabG [Myxococcales bacterium]|nr:3-oxoacyl-ACP reductase FabG [Myxococcales bacterium]